MAVSGVTTSTRGECVRAHCRRAAALCLVVTLAAVLAGCATRKPAPVQERSPASPAVVAPVPAPIVSPAPAAEPMASPAPDVDWRPATYTVKRGDTLHAIALDHGLDYRDLVTWNAIENPNVIRVGQVLRLSPPGESTLAPAGSGVTTTPLRTAPPVLPADARPAPTPPAAPIAMPLPRNADNYKTGPKVIKEPYTEQAWREMQRAAAPVVATPPPSVGVPAPVAVAQAPATSGRAEAKPPVPDAKPPAAVAASEASGIDWLWPAVGKVITGFSDTSNLKGIDISGKAGAPVHASAAGKVVYAGTGLRGYGKLIIVKHDATFLSAYAHNREILVREGQQVTRGQKIAEMGNTDSDQVKLHFEIRRLGKPVDPLRYLPPQ